MQATQGRVLSTLLSGTYPASLFSMAKARTVRTLPRASSATAVALATCTR